VVRDLLGKSDPSPDDGVYPPDHPGARFWDAEDYHQKYRLRRRARFVARLEKELGPTWDRYPIATKLNAMQRDGDPTPILVLLSEEAQAAYSAR
jgi:hypothetical protein